MIFDQINQNGGKLNPFSLSLSLSLSLILSLKPSLKLSLSLSVILSLSLSLSLVCRGLRLSHTSALAFIIKFQNWILSAAISIGA